MIEKAIKHKKSSEKYYRFSILIPTWNNIEYLKICISSIRKHSSLSIQIIVFVNEGNDGTAEWLDKQEDIDYICSDKNVGVCYSLNISRTLIKSDYIVYVNDDMYVLPGWDIELDREISKLSTNFFMLSSTMIEPTDIGSPCVVVKDYGRTVKDFNEALLLKEFRSLAIKDWSGSTWPPNVVHKDLWDLVGGLSIEFSPGMYSDPDFSKKLYESGVRIFKGIGNSLVYHFARQTTKRLKKSNGRNLFLLKWGITSNVFCNKILKRGKPYRLLNKKNNIALDVIIGKLKIIKLLFTFRRI